MTAPQHLPLYNVARGQSDTLSLIPPVDFTGVTLRYIPLPARLDRLQRFIDRFLNLGTRQSPRGDHWFDVAAPMVFLTLVDYGRMAVAAVNEGWTAQYEIAFQVPLCWYKRSARGTFELDSMAWVSPFIFVDNVMSMDTGREVYGWEKTLARITTSPSAWTQREMGPEQIVSVSAHSVASPYAGEAECVGSILSITHQAVGRVPPDFGQLLSPLPQALEAMVAMPRWMIDVFRSVFEGPGTVPLDPFDPGTYPAWLSAQSWTSAAEVPPLGRPLEHGAAYLRALVQMVTAPVNTINLKQFRAAGEAGYSKAAYQAITNAPIGFLSIDAMGLMGPGNAALGQFDGGLRVIVPPSSFDIVASLGLEVKTRTWNTRGEEVDELVPMFPFWMRADMRYGSGENVDVRSEQSFDAAPGYCDSQTLAPADAELPDYNTALGAASQQMLGPFESPHTTVRVLPLAADRAALARFLREYLDELELPHGDRFEPWGDFVYLLVISMDDMVSTNNPVQTIDTCTVTYAVPIRWYQTNAQGERTLVSVGYVTPFSFSSEPELAITLSEVGGTDTMAATIVGPPDVWIDDAGPDPATPQALMRLRAEVLPALNMGAKVENRVVAEVLRGITPHRANDDLQWRRIAARWGQTMQARHQAMIDGFRADTEAFRTLWTMALEVLANDRSFRPLTLKQFRDAARPERACYQALVQGSMTILGDIHDMREMPEVLHVRMPRYPTLPIAERLGLVPKATKIESEGLVDYFQPMRPFWFRAATRYDTGQCIYRCVAGEWVVISQPCRYFDAPQLELGLGLLDEVNARGRTVQRLRDTVQTWRARAADPPPAAQSSYGPPPTHRITREQAEHAVETFEPQPIIEAMLSKEWGHWGSPRWLKAKHRVEQLVALHQKLSHQELPTEQERLEQVRQLITVAGSLRALWANPDRGPLGQQPLFCVPRQSIVGREGALFFEHWKSLAETDQWQFLDAVYCHSPGTEQLSTTLQKELSWMFEQIQQLEPRSILLMDDLVQYSPGQHEEPECLLPDLPPPPTTYGAD